MLIPVSPSIHARTTTVEHVNLQDMTNSIKEIPELGVQLPEWLVTLHLYV